MVLSGGQDSTTCAALACRQFDAVYAVTFEYNQRHAIELESAQAVSEALALAGQEVIRLGPVLKGTSPLVSDAPVGEYDSPEQLPGGVEPTFIPGRNILFLTIAANRAYCLGCRDIFIGVCEADFAGYWDCRQLFIDAMAKALGEGIYGDPAALRIHAPLMHLSKAQTVRLSAEVLGERFEEVLEQTHTCYQGIRGGCGRCHACILRDRGFREAKIADPIWKYRKEPIKL
ncbi:queuosine biosynthesis protein QueC [Gloeobacter kilaueensis JS1]|uniref:7-cyano-7-deazaguanine synthase n=1 Tax=Gloeobacter kilaueensis (strain ATCC BAA-2537 / CCAP 1431/1 / ULC 316 / JS1) TaxID=1183438 RepID=U5QCG5_GLOK1|nr:queuosine biosynthesis protein QueC [Gloeobacter kilaueensis JS1]